ncbi:hypothetical protein AB0K18_49925 [Nonomuraea sp. NPDC049421]|uniref:hypothetical protein n=1 Tax=Nonomuraea sp. NPDC049421 TaxID=3155275 RepID=UPI003429D7FF
MSKMGTALRALGSLLDRSLAQIAEASADARIYDRQTIYKVADVWDNNTFPLFHAATAYTSVGRERRARAALAWMADLGSARRSRMVEQAATAGHSLERLLPPPAANPPRSRDYRGQVRPSTIPLTADAALELGTDYDFAAAEIRTLLLERAGTRMTGSLVLVPPRRYNGGLQAGEPPELKLWLEDITNIHFDSDDRIGVALHCQAGKIVIGIGASGELRATSGTVYPHDYAWHLSTAGQTADQQTPPPGQRTRRTSERRRPRPKGAVLVAARILHSVMLEIRMVRYAHLSDRVPVRPLADALAGAGTDILAAGTLRGRRREKAFRNLVETWIKNGDPALTPWFTDELHRTNSSEQLPEATKEWIEEITAPEAPPSLLPTGRDLNVPIQANLRFAKYTAAHTIYETPQNSSTVVVLAHPPMGHDSPSERWQLHVFEVENVSRFKLRTEAFDGSHEIRTDRETVSVDSLILGHDYLDVHGRKAQRPNTD